MKFLTLLLSVLVTLSACNAEPQQPSSANLPPAASSETTCTPEASSPAVISYEIGDIILTDGSVVKTAELTALNENSLPMAVIAGFRADGTAFGIGVHRSGGPLQWAPAGTPGNSIKFTETVCTDPVVGDTDGSDNWAMICSADPQGITDTAANYPAFHFVNTYAEAYQLPENYASGWYMPSIAEVCTVYDNRAAVNASLQTIYGLDSDTAMDGLGTVWYWASSQADSDDDYVWFEHYFNGYSATCPKDFDNLHVMAVHAF